MIAFPMAVLSCSAAPADDMPRAAELAGSLDPIWGILILARGIERKLLPIYLVLQMAIPVVILAVV